jgi:hypothetical protein
MSIRLSVVLSALLMSGACIPATGMAAEATTTAAAMVTPTVAADAVSTPAFAAKAAASEPVPAVASIPAFPGAVPIATVTSTRGRPLAVEGSFAALASERTTSASRARFMDDLLTTRIPAGWSAPLTSATEGAWSGAMWASKILDRRTPETRAALRAALRASRELDEDFRRSAMETAYALFPRGFEREMARIALDTTSPKHFAMATLYLARARSTRGTQRELLRTLYRKFPGLRADGSDPEPHPILIMLERDLKGARRWDPRSRPPLVELFSREFLPGATVAYSLQRRDRRQPGIVVVRRPDGRFMRHQDGTLFQAMQLAISNSNLPGYITNGNSPQGILSVVGVDTTRNQFIGTTPFLETMVPFEAPPERFFHDPSRTGTSWTLEMYDSMLPGDSAGKGWRDWAPVHEAYYAGKAGRSEMLTHGTTIDPEPWLGAPFYPNTPSLGCLTALEVWSGRDGRALLSDQIALVNAFVSAGGTTGFLVLVELDDEKRPVSLYDVLPDLLAADDAAR